MDDYDTLFAMYPVIEHFKYQHLPPHLQIHSKPFCEMAFDIARKQPEYHREIEKALDHLMYCKDAAVRAMVKR